MTEQTTTRETVRARLDKALEAVQASVAGLGDAEMQAISITTEWSVADLLRHALSWDEIALRCLEEWDGPREWIPEIARTDGDAYNAELLDVKSTLEGTMVLDSIKSIYERLAAVLDASTDAELESQSEAPWGGQISQLDLIDGTLAHDEEHAAQIAAVRA